MQLGQLTGLEEAERQAIEVAVLADAGGGSACSEIRRHLIADFAFAVLLRDTMAGNLQAKGALTKKGARRASVDLYLQASARAERLAKAIGLEARAVDVPDLREYLRERQT